MSLSVELDFRPTLGPIRDQGFRPTCLSHAASAAHEHARGSTVPLSPEYLHYFASIASQGVGASVAEISEALVKDGQPTETRCPYHPGGVPSDWRPPKGVPLYRRDSVVKHPTTTEVDTSLRVGRLPILGISLPETFYTPVSPWVISPIGALVGFHAVLAVGTAASSVDRRYLIRNSWGPEWADSGHAWLDRSFLHRHLRHVLVLAEEPS